MSRPIRRMTGPLVAALAVATAACNSGDSVTAKNESVQDVAKKVAATNIRPQPGRWESTLKLEKMEMEEMPPQAREAMAAQLGKGQTFLTCLTPEQAERPDGGFFQGGAKDCVYKNFTMAGGRIAAEMTCGKAPQVATMTMTGDYSETSYAIRASSQSEMMPGKPMKMTMAVTSRRVGECDGTEGK